MKLFTSVFLSTLTAVISFVPAAQAEQDLTKISLACNVSVTNVVAEALRRDLIVQLRNQLQAAMDKNTVAVSVKFSKKGATPRQDFNVADYKGGLSLSPSIGANPPEGEPGEINISLSGSSVSGVPQQACSVVHKVSVAASFRRTDLATNKKTKFKGTLSSSNITVNGYFDKK